jgi:hypothetical protein
MQSPNRFSTKARKMLTSGLFLLVFGSCFSIMLTMAYASLGPTVQEKYITLSTVGSDMTTRSIYPSSDSFVSRNATLDWNVQLYNHMSETEYLAIRVKLLNATQFGPDEARHLPSPISHIYEQRLILGDNSTATLPLVINLKEVMISGADSTINAISINGKEISKLNVSNEKSSTFKFVIELWRYDVKFENFVYTWPSGPESESAWNQIRIQVK